MCVTLDEARVSPNAADWCLELVSYPVEDASPALFQSSSGIIDKRLQNLDVPLIYMTAEVSFVSGFESADNPADRWDNHWHKNADPMLLTEPAVDSRIEPRVVNRGN